MHQIPVSSYKMLLALIATLMMGGLQAEPTPLQEPSVSLEINTIVAAKRHPYLKQANFSNRSDDLVALYKLFNDQLLWLNPNSSTNTAEVLALLENAYAQGLYPDHYDVATLKEKYQVALTLAPTAYKELAQFDTALSLALLRYVHDLHYGRVDPQGINYKLRLRDKKALDIPALIKDSLFLNTVAKIDMLAEPKLMQYQKLKSALAAYRQITAQHVPVKFVVKGKLRSGQSHPQLAELGRFLEAVGDLPEYKAQDNADKKLIYTPDLVEGVKKFQERHGLGADGTIGPSTVATLNEPLPTRISQIEMAMERLRWLPEMENIDKTIIVNIPSFQLWAIDGTNGAAPEITQMRVVVGKSVKNQTPVLMAEMSFIEFMPYWNVPKNILKDEILPKLSRKPGFLASQNMELVAKSGKPLPLNQDYLDKLRKGQLRVRQRPGTRNSLGKVKFIFPNKDDVYLHDTPSTALFSRSRRDFSHGCVRVEKPKVLAEFALKNQGKWNAETIQKAMRSSANLRVDLAKPIPVLFFYTTAFVDQDNNLAFFPDIYGHDNVLAVALKTNADVPDHAIFVSTPPNAAEGTAESATKNSAEHTTGANSADKVTVNTTEANNIDKITENAAKNTVAPAIAP
jgi:L,D-transpeptidase YcbB